MNTLSWTLDGKINTDPDLQNTFREYFHNIVYISNRALLVTILTNLIYFSKYTFFFEIIMISSLISSLA